jgi:hypothetical protein
MISARIPTAVGTLAIVLASCVMAIRAQTPQTRAPLPLEPLGENGEAIFPAFEGWGPHKDGSIVLLLGYYNRNRSGSIDIPIGPNNRIEPGGPDLGQPTHFEPSRHHGVFAIRLPKDFKGKNLTWTIVANGQTSSVSFWMNPPYWIDFFRNQASGNQPPVIRFSENGPTLTGPPLGFAQTLTATPGQPLTLRLWASDSPATRKGAEAELAALRGTAPRNQPPPVAIVGGQVLGAAGAGRGGGREAGPPPDIVVNWKKHRAPGGVAFAQERIPLHTKGDPNVFLEATTTATFDAPGDYVLRAHVNDESGDGGGGDQCCWTTAHVNVTVK